MSPQTLDNYLFIVNAKLCNSHFRRQRLCCSDLAHNQAAAFWTSAMFPPDFHEFHWINLNEQSVTKKTQTTQRDFNIEDIPTGQVLRPGR